MKTANGTGGRVRVGASGDALRMGVAIVVAGIALILIAPATDDSPPPTQDVPGSENTASNVVSQYAVPPPPFSDGIFPCSDCHTPDDTVNRTPHPVPEHDTVIFEHDSQNRWCLDCHDAQQRNMLRLASGALLDFRESYTLCGQCHGEKLRDWKAGEHGKRTGFWNGEKQYLLCVHCHNPHSPRFKPLKPLPPPDPQGPAK